MKNDKKPIVWTMGPLVKEVKSAAQVRLVQIAKRNIEQGKFKPAAASNN